jgi:hypothetical protein
LAFAAMATIALVAGRSVRQANLELAAAGNALRHETPRRAIDHYRRALRWSPPFTRHEQRAIAGLELIAEAAENDGDRETALLAWRSIVGGVAASRFLYSGRSSAREHASDEIARLAALQGGPQIDAAVSQARRQAVYRQLLQREAAPQPFWATALLLGFFVWIVSLAILTLRAFDSAGRFSWPDARSTLTVAILGLASFLLGLVFA